MPVTAGEPRLEDPPRDVNPFNDLHHCRNLSWTDTRELCGRNAGSKEEGCPMTRSVEVARERREQHRVVGLVQACVDDVVHSRGVHPSC